MKKIIMVVLVMLLSASYNQVAFAAKGLKNKAAKVEFRDPGRFNGKWVPFKIDSVTYHTYYKDETGSNEYGVSIKGKIKGKKESIYYKASSTQEIEYFQKVFKSNYKQIRLFMNDYKKSVCDNNKCFTYGIIVEY